MPSGIRNVIILLAILTLVLVGVSIYVGLELSKNNNIDSDPAEAYEACGNNTCEVNETCDGVERCTGDGDFSIGDCRNDCTYCGDGVVQIGEECDDSNDNDDDSCSNSCKSKENVDVVATPTPTPISTVTPTPTSSVTTCGNLTCDSGESCDGQSRCEGDGTFNESESCRLDCTYCGDGKLQSTEECDDGNTNDSDACSNTCIINVQGTGSCGDGIIQESEQCDIGLSTLCSSGLQCNSTCECVQSNPQVQADKVCGASCSSNNDCPVDNICESGKCVLLACSKSIGGLSGNIGQSNNQASVCTANGCEIVQCGGECGANKACPNGLSCNSDNKCVFTYCINNECSNQCQLPRTALGKEDMKAILQSLMVILLGLVGYQFIVINNSFSLATSIANLPLFRSFRKDVKVAKEKKRFESQF